MPILDRDQIRRLEHIVVDGKTYNLHISVYKEHIYSAVIGLSPDGTYLPMNKWATGVRAADRILGDTSEYGRWRSFPHCALIIKQKDESFQIRNRVYYEIDLDGVVN